MSLRLKSEAIKTKLGSFAFGVVAEARHRNYGNRSGVVRASAG